MAKKSVDKLVLASQILGDAWKHGKRQQVPDMSGEEVGVILVEEDDLYMALSDINVYLRSLKKK